MEAKHFTTTFMNERVPVYYIKDRAQAAQAIQQMMAQDCLFAIDTETMPLPQWEHVPEAGLSPHLAKIRLLQTFNNRAVCVFDMLHIDCPQLFYEFLETKRFIAHFAMFDLGFFYKMGVRKMNMGCTHILAKLMFHATQPTDEGLKASLEGLCNGLFGRAILKELQNSEWKNPELTFEQVEYAAIDTVALMRVAEKMAPVVTGYKLERYYQLCKDAQHPLVHMQLKGFRMNEEGHRSLIADWLVRLNDARKEVVKVLGSDTISSVTIGEWLERNLDRQTLMLWPRTDGGKLQTDAHAFSDFAGIAPIIEPFSKFQRLKTLTANFGNKLLQQINPATGRLHAIYRLNGARTSRLSCSNPNLQQLPAARTDPFVRKNFIPADGLTFLCADYSQIELRVAAELSQDRTMLDAYRNGIDLHALTASKVSGKPLSAISKLERFQAKAINFGFLFGLGAKKFSHYAKKSYQADFTEEQSFEAIRTFRETYPGYHAWQLKQAEMAARSLQVRTPCGKLRKMDPENTYGAAMNTPVQSGAAECMLYALIKLHDYLNQTGWGKLVNVIHDEVVVEALPEKKDKVAEMIEVSMRDGFLEVFPKGVTRGIVEVGCGPNWGEAKT